MNARHVQSFTKRSIICNLQREYDFRLVSIGSSFLVRCVTDFYGTGTFAYIRGHAPGISQRVRLPARRGRRRILADKHKVKDFSRCNT